MELHYARSKLNDLKLDTSTLSNMNWFPQRRWHTDKPARMRYLNLQLYI